MALQPQQDFSNYLSMLASQGPAPVAWSAGAELALPPEIGWGMGYETAGDAADLLESMGYEVGNVASPNGTRLVARPRPGRIVPPRLAPRPLAPSAPGPMGPVRDEFDKVYTGAGREAGSGFPETAQGHSTQTLANGATFTLSFTAKQAFVLTSLSLNDIAAGKLARGCQLTNLQLSISGQPAAGFPTFGAARFASDCMNRRIEPVECPTSVSVEFTATALVDSGTATFEVNIMGIRLMSGLTYATRY